MKNIMFLCCLFSITAGSLMAQQQRITVQADKMLNHDFSDYKTFDYASMVDNDLEAGLYFVNELVLRNEVRDAMTEALMGIGYTKTKTNPDLVISFRLFDEPTTLKGFEGYGESYWSNQRVRHISDTATYRVKEGTLLVNIVDRKNSQVVFQGFASGLIEGEKFSKDRVRIREAVRMILDEYGETANEYSRN